MCWILVMYLLIFTKKYAIAVQDPIGGRRDLLSHKVLLFLLTHQCPGLQRMFALLCTEFIQADSLHQKRHLCLVNAPLCVLRYSFMQACSRAVRVCHHASRAAVSFLSFWLIHQLTIPFRYDMEVLSSPPLWE